ncbi:MAG: hypothetical protein H6Q86_5384, partial [candidate division NC10 bacterium]|nr:hypothetical protein [candidate division NC10 bacterium]
WFDSFLAPPAVLATLGLAILAGAGAE